MFQDVSVHYIDSLFVFASSLLHSNHVAKLPVLSGVVKPGDRIPSWVKLCGVFLDGCVTSNVTTDRAFTFTNLSQGTFYIWLFDSSSEIVASGRTDIRNPGGTLVLDPLAPPGEQIGGSH